MPGDFLRRAPQITMPQFHALRETRPREEKWELIDGVPMMMPPPTLIHQRVSLNLNWLLNERLERTRPDWRADIEIGVLLDGEDKYNPEPDVTVIDAEVEIGQIYAARFYFVAEVLSNSDDTAVIDAKLAYYRAHPYNRGVLFVRQDRVAAVLHVRQEMSEWRKITLSAPDGVLDIPGIGPIGRLSDLYRHTPLFPKEADRGAS